MPGPDTAVTAVKRLKRDESGAIVVMGIFMCTGVVGMLWYLAGIGDAIQFRERLQGSADAAAFSSAVLHARGMNLIVMLNMIMACVLAIRVIMKMIIAALVIVGTILTAIWPTFGLGMFLLNGANTINGYEQSSRPAIDQTLRALSAVQVGIQYVVPPASIIGAQQVGERYRPVQEDTIALGYHMIDSGLPVDKGTTTKLCEMAGEAVGTLLAEMLPGGLSFAKDDVVDFAGEVVKKGGAYFCALDDSVEPPDLSEEFNGASDRACDDEIDQLRADRDELHSTYMAACQAYNAPCRPGRGPYNPAITEEEQADLDQKRAARDAKQAEIDAFDHDECVDEKVVEMQDELEANGGEAETSEGAGEMTPKMVHPDWYNGSVEAQILALSVGNTESLQVAPNGLDVGSWNNVRISEPDTARFALAQSEFFYDCDGTWDSDVCNTEDTENGEAMWNFAWRARLRRYNRPFDFAGLLELAAGAEAMRRASEAVDPASMTWGSAALLGELGDAVSDGDLLIH